MPTPAQARRTSLLIFLKHKKLVKKHNDWKQSEYYELQEVGLDQEQKINVDDSQMKKLLKK